MSGAPHRRADSLDRSAVRVALTRFVIGSVVTLLVIVAISFLVARLVSRDVALDEAKSRALNIADGLAAPLVTTSFRDGDPGAMSDMNRLMSRRMSDSSIRHIKIWSDDGTILWADESDLIGRHFPLDAEQRHALRTGAATAEYSALDAAENVDERDEPGPVLETYVGAVGADGSRILFETYTTPEQVAARQQAILRATVIVGLIALAVFAVAQVPLSLRLARGVERAHRDRERMTRHALMSSELERRRIAQDLHDDVIQELAGVGYVLPTVTERVQTQQVDPRRDSALLERLQDLLTRNVQRLRSMMTEIYPPDLSGDGLANAIQGMAEDASSDLCHVELRMEPGLVLREGAARLTYRLVREGLRNVVTHAEASSALVELRRESGVVHVLVADDGRGVEISPDGQVLEPEGHLGLRLLKDSVADAGGELVLEPNQPHGTRLRASFSEDVPGF